MSKLLLIENNEAVSSFDLIEGKITIGRGADCEIQLEDEAISRQHVRIVTLMGNSILEDLGSSNGTYVNGKLSRKCALNHGDVIQIGEKELRFSQPADSTSSSQGKGDADATRIITPGNFGPATTEAQAENRSRDGISPVTYAAQDADPAKPAAQETPDEKPGSGGLWGWIRRLFS